MIKRLFLILFICNFLIANEFDDFENEFSSNDIVINDKFYSYNQFMTEFNYAIYNMSFRPITNIYNTITPKPIRQGVSNFFHNLSSPLRFLTLFLSAKFKEGFAELGTFLGNTTLGFGGILRPYKYEKKSDFGLLLARWGVPPGEHLVLPFFGPSNLRDAFALPFDIAAQPTMYLDGNTGYVINGLGLINKVNNEKALLEEAYKGVNPYITIRNFYEKNREELK